MPLSLALWLWCVSAASALAAPVFYTSSNTETHNQIIRFETAANGQWNETGRFDTGGAGTGHNLPAANSLAISKNHKWLAAVNAGSHQVSLFRLGQGQPKLTAVQDSGGLLPVSVSFKGPHLYVLNSGSDRVVSFRITSSGQLDPLGRGGVGALSVTKAGATSLGVTPDGRHLVVAERGANRLSTFPLDRSGGFASGARSLDTEAKAPYALSFFEGLIYTVFAGQAANQSAVGPFRFDRIGQLIPRESPVFTGQTAACWSALSPKRRLLYTSNAGSHSLTGFYLGRRGVPRLMNQSGISVETGAENFPRDMTFSPDGKTLAVLLSGTGSIRMYNVDAKGLLKSSSTLAGVATGAAGLVAQ